MMEIKQILCKPYEKSLFPSLKFDVEISYAKYQEAIIYIDGWIETDDGKIIAEIKEARQDISIPPCSLSAYGSSFDSHFEENIYKTILIAILNNVALKHIDNRRMMNRKGDVILNLILNVREVDNKARISFIHEIEPNQIGIEKKEIFTENGKTSNWYILAYASLPNFSSSTQNRWILSGDGNPIFLEIKGQTLKKKINIGLADWLHDYAPNLGLGEYFIVEIPKGMKLIKDAWVYIEKAEKCFRIWDTKGVYANCRECGKLLDRALQEKLGKDSFAYKERWGRTYKRFKNMSFSDFASLDLHIEDIKKSQRYHLEEIKIDKPDVEHVLIVTKALIKYAEQLS